MRQGRCCDAWVLNALGLLSSCAAGQECLRRCVVSSARASAGIYTFRFWKEGRWAYVHVDDRVPCDASGAPMFARCVRGNEVWAPLIEKALAKLHGSYLNLEGGLVLEALRDLSGGVALEFERGWDALEERLQAGLVVGARILAGPGERRADGLLCGWSYCVAALARPSTAAGEQVRFVKLVDPWLRSRWKGRWHSADPSWARFPELKEALCADDEWPVNEYWLQWEDFEAAFAGPLLACAPLPAARGWARATFEGRFEPDSAVSGAGGSPNNEQSWLRNPMLVVRVGDTAGLAVTLRQPRDARLEDFFDPARCRGFRLASASKARAQPQEAHKAHEAAHPGPGRRAFEEAEEDEDEEAKGKSESGVAPLLVDRSGLGLVVCRLGRHRCGRRRLLRLARDKVVAHSGLAYQNARDASCLALQLPKGDYVVVPSTFNAGVRGAFALDLFYQSPSVELQFDAAQVRDLFAALENDGPEEEEADSDEEGGKPRRQPMLRFSADDQPLLSEDRVPREQLEAQALQALMAELFQP